MRHFFNITLCTLAALFFAAALPAQSLLQQAIELRSYVDTTIAGTPYFTVKGARAAECLAALARAAGMNPSGAESSDILDRYAGNPFLNRHTLKPRVAFPDIYQSTTPASGLRATSTTPGRTAGVFSAGTIADGIAKFLVTRTKQELSIAFFEDFQKAVANNEHISTLFPATALTLESIGEQIYQFDNYLNDLRQSFDKDMRVLPTNLKVYIVEQDLFQKTPYREILAEDLLDVAQAIVNKTSPDSILLMLATSAALQQPARLAAVTDAAIRARLQDLGGGLKVVNLFSESLRCPPSKGIWFPRADIDKALSDNTTLHIYLGLLWQSGKNIKFANGKSFSDVLGKLTVFDELRDELRNFSTYAQEVVNGQKAYAQYLVENPAAESTDVLPYEPFYTFCNGLFGLMETGARFKRDFASVVGAPTKFDTVFINTLQGLNDLNYDVHAQLYASAVNDLIQVLDNLLGADFTFRAPLIKYGRFIANMAEADNSDEVAAAIDAVALPPGSSRLKKESSWSISLNAYTGAGAGQERLEQTGKKAATLALSAPVGIAFSKGIHKSQSLSLFVPIIDVGAIVSFRFADPDAGDLPELKWSNLFAPGAYVVWGPIKKWPLVIGLGAQHGPALRKIDTMQGVISDSAWRYGGFLSVDIPVFNLFSK